MIKLSIKVVLGIMMKGLKIGIGVKERFILRVFTL
jgi:hypothetical protein